MKTTTHSHPPTPAYILVREHLAGDLPDWSWVHPDDVAQSDHLVIMSRAFRWNGGVRWPDEEAQQTITIEHSPRGDFIVRETEAGGFASIHLFEMYEVAATHMLRLVAEFRSSADWVEVQP